MKDLFFNAIGLSKQICRSKLKKGDIAIDATMGNGNDTAFLCDLVGENGKVYAFDIQEDAIINTKERLLKLNFENIASLIYDGHENMDKYVKEEVALIMFNLGYLPKGDHEITTNKDTTLTAIKKGMDMLLSGGLILLVIYSGHESGKEEKIVINEFVSTLDQKLYNVVNMKFANQINTPPEIICIEKR